MGVYNTYENVPKIPYNIIIKLARSNNEDLWKAIYYDNYDCLSEKNLTFKEKVNLIWKNETDESNFKIFFKPLIAEEITKATTQLRINNVLSKPINQYEGIIVYEFDIITGYRNSLIDLNSIPVPRIDFIEQQLLKELNGADLGISGARIFSFDREIDRNCNSQLSLSNSKTFYGRALKMAIVITNLEPNTCGNYNDRH